MSAPLRRYKLEYSNYIRAHAMAASDDGEYVLYTDHMAAVQALESAAEFHASDATNVYADFLELSQEVNALVAAVPLPPHAITFERGWELLNKLQAFAVKMRNPKAVQS